MERTGWQSLAFLSHGRASNDDRRKELAGEQGNASFTERRWRAARRSLSSKALGVHQIMAGIGEFCANTKDSMDDNVEMLTSYGWYGTCSRNLIMIGSKLPSNFSEVDRNWQWPEKTWFRERLNAVKAQENGQRRKLVISPRQSAAATPASETQPDTLKVD
jgi:hypothetical protein